MLMNSCGVATLPEKGGAIGYTCELSGEGKDFVMSSRLSSRVLGSAPILVIALFSGIGGNLQNL